MSSAAPSILSIFTDALKYQSPEERSAYLDRTCAGHPALREEVERLLEAHASAKGFLETTDAPSPHHEFSPGTTIDGRYKLLESIGEGGMGTVWVAEQLAPIRRKVAIKLVKPGMDSRQVLARFEAERQALALMDHPNIAKVYDGGVTEHARPYFVMEYVKGIPLTKYCDDARLPLPERLKLYVQVCQAVQHAHQKGIIHRDLKPSNILVCLYDGQPVPKVIDFGLAKAMHQPLTEHTLHTAHGFMVGTPLYMSPEQAEFNNLDVDTRTDIYSLGVILYELLTGSTPLEQQQFNKAALDEMLRLIKEVEPPKPSTRLSGSASLPSIAAQRGLDPAQLSKQVRGDLDWIVMKTLEKERSRRYETANGLARDVERFLQDEPVEACPPSTSYRLQKLLRKHRRTAIAAAAILSALVLGIAGTSYGLYRARQAVASEEKQRKLAETNSEKARKLAESEGEAKKRAEQGQAELQAVLDFVTERIFAAARPTGVLGGLGREVTLREAMDNAAPFVESSFRDRPLIEARLRGTLGASYFHLEDYSTAAAQFEAAYQLIENQEGLERFRSSLLCHLALCRSREGKHGEAAKIWDRGMAIIERGLGSSHPSIIVLQVTTADLYLKADRAEDAQIMLQETLSQFENTLGPQSPAVLDAKVSLARSHFAQHHVDDALQLMEQVVDSRIKSNGADDPQTSNAKWYWAQMVLEAHLSGYQFQSHVTPEHALAVLETALADLRKAWGDRNWLIVEKMQAVAQYYIEFSRIEDAARLMEELVSVGEDWTGADAESTSRYKSSLAQVYLEADRPSDALLLLEQILPRLTAKFGADDDRVKVARELRIFALRELGQMEQAAEASRELLTSLQESNGDAVNAASLAKRGHILARTGKWSEAIAALEQSIVVRPYAEDAWYLVAHLYAIQGDQVGYRRHCEKMLARYRKAQNPTLAERVSKSCMLVPDAGLELAPIVALAQVGTTGTEQHPYYRYFLSTRALAHYRSNEFQQAYDAAQACISSEGQESMNPATGWLISSMALAKLERRDEAMTARRNAEDSLEKLNSPAWNSGDLGGEWFNLVYIHLLREECEALLKAGNVDSTVDGGGKKEEADVN